MSNKKLVLYIIVICLSCGSSKKDDFSSNSNNNVNEKNKDEKVKENKKELDTVHVDKDSGNNLKEIKNSIIDEIEKREKENLIVKKQAEYQPTLYYNQVPGGGYQDFLPPQYYYEPYQYYPHNRFELHNPIMDNNRGGYYPNEYMPYLRRPYDQFVNHENEKFNKRINSAVNIKDTKCGMNQYVLDNDLYNKKDDKIYLNINLNQDQDQNNNSKKNIIETQSNKIPNNNEFQNYKNNLNENQNQDNVYSQQNLNNQYNYRNFENRNYLPINNDYQNNFGYSNLNMNSDQNFDPNMYRNYNNTQYYAQNNDFNENLNNQNNNQPIYPLIYSGKKTKKRYNKNIDCVKKEECKQENSNNNTQNVIYENENENNNEMKYPILKKSIIKESKDKEKEGYNDDETNEKHGCVPNAENDDSDSDSESSESDDENDNENSAQKNINFINKIWNKVRRNKAKDNDEDYNKLKPVVSQNNNEEELDITAAV